MPAHELLTEAHEPQGQDTQVVRRLVVAWQHPVERSIEPVGFLTRGRNNYRFDYIRNVTRVKGFRPLMGFERLTASYQSDKLFPIFEQRAMDPRRPDYQRYVAHLGLEGDPTPWEQIARSQGRREGDTIQLFPEPVTDGSEIHFLFLVHGIRHAHENEMTLNDARVKVTRRDVEGALEALRTGDELEIIPEPENPKNPQAIVVMGDPRVPVGWIPDLLVADLHRLMQQADVRVTAEQVNGPDAPGHLRLLARLHAAPASGFRFFTGERWELLGAGAAD